MRYAAIVISIVFCCVTAWPDTPPQTSSSPLCGDSTPGMLACRASKADLKSAKDAFARGLKLQNAKKLDEALAEFEEAARVIPHNLDYLTAREMLRQQLVFDHITKGNEDLIAGRQIEALAEFRSAIQLDPANT